MPINRNMTGVYYFEDENLDLFLIFDYKQTTQQHGPNYSDEFYKVMFIYLATRRRNQPRG